VKSTIKHIFWGLLLLGPLLSAQPIFVSNEGQWQGDFDSKIELSNGAIFLDSQGYVASFLNIPHEHQHEHSPLKSAKHKLYSYRMTFVGASNESHWTAKGSSFHPRHYFLGSDSQLWRSNVSSSSQSQLENIYPGISVEMLAVDDRLKYNFLLAPKADASLIIMHYEGLERLQLKNKVLYLETKLGTISETIPLAYQLIDGKKIKVKCEYQISGNEVHFKLGRYKDEYPLVIDPILDFSTFSGSGDLNFGNSATYGDNGSIYGAGVNFGINYPVTSGVFQSTFGGDSAFNVDVSISKFDATGQQLLYATYLGGRDIEVVHSIISNEQGDLYVLGNTGSSNFPTTAGAFQKNFAGGNFQSSFAFNDYDFGSDIFIAKISNDGSQLLHSTFWGGTGNDGFNEAIYKNYGDHYRGEIIIGEDGEILIVSSTNSLSIPLNGTNTLQRNENSQEAIVGVFNDQLSSLQWASFYGGTGAETGYSIKEYANKVYITGTTASDDLELSSNPIFNSRQGDFDGYIASFNSDNGSLLSSTYFGTDKEDQSFLMDLDYDGNIYIFGQTKGVILSTPGVFNQSGSRQFLAKIDSSLTDILWQTTIGSGQNKQDIVPSAFMVDKCLNIYISGWGGLSNSVSFPAIPNGNSFSLTTTTDAFQTNTDGSDFYFMVLGHDASQLLYASYFGGSDNEHVDGGTSRFSKDGTIYQAVCSNCNNRSFPTTPNGYSPTSGNNSCNMAVLKFSFQQILEANAQISFTTEIDSICDGLKVNFQNRSNNATNYQWLFGNGDSSTSFSPSVTYQELGTYPVTLIAFDTICNISDTTKIEIIHDKISQPTASFSSNYISCDSQLEASFQNSSIRANRFFWDFGDGFTSTEAQPTHQFGSFQDYSIMLIAEDSICDRSDTLYQTIIFRDSAVFPHIKPSISSCSNGAIDISIENDRSWFLYYWQVESKNYVGSNPNIKFSQPGIKNFNVLIKDTLCNREYVQNFELTLDEIRNEIYAPNAFTPNGDGLNDSYEIYGDPCTNVANLKIFNRWGELVFETNKPYSDFWNGTFKGSPASGGVYTFIILEAEQKEQGYLNLIR
jgi:gliding motility-associated-like protein